MAVSVEVATLFLREMKARGVAVTVRDDGLYQVGQGDHVNTINLDNLSKEFERDRDPGRVKHFVESILTRPTIPTWEEARERLYFVPEPSDHEFGDTVRVEVSDTVSRVLAHLNAAGNQLMWVSEHILEHWGQPREAAEAVAGETMARLLREAPLNIHEMDGMLYGTFGINSPFKAALVFAPNVREVVGARLGWPLFALIPSRDFVYLFAEKDQGLLGTLGLAAVEEFENGGYPVSRDVFRISDDGVEAVFELQVFKKPQQGPEDGLKTVSFQGAVSFRVPEAWDEEEVEDNGMDYSDPHEDTGTLRLRLRTYQVEGAIDADQVASLMSGQAAEEGTEVERLEGGNSLVAYMHRFEEDDGPCRMWVWVIGNPVLPRYFRTALFTYTVHEEQAEDDDIVELLATLDAEIRRATFAPTLE